MKVGYAGNVVSRIEGLSGQTGVPDEYSIVYYKQASRKIHDDQINKGLKDIWLPGKKKDFFYVDIALAREIINRIVMDKTPDDILSPDECNLWELWKEERKGFSESLRRKYNLDQQYLYTLNDKPDTKRHDVNTVTSVKKYLDRYSNEIKKISDQFFCEIDAYYIITNGNEYVEIVFDIFSDSGIVYFGFKWPYVPWMQTGVGNWYQTTDVNWSIVKKICSDVKDRELSIVNQSNKAKN